MDPRARHPKRPQPPPPRGARLLAGGLAALLWISPAVPAMAANWAVIAMYHRFGEAGFSATNIPLDQFEEHLEELKSGAHTVLPVPEILGALKAGKPLPEGAVGITIDGGYRSFYREAWPRLKAAELPVTVVVSTDPLDQGAPSYMTWDQIRELAGAGVTIAAQTASHLHMADASLEEVEAELARSNERFRAELGLVPEIFAYPYGEVSLAVREKVIEAGYRFALGQHSGVVHAGSDFFNLPRFGLSENYGDLRQFRLRIRTLPLPVTDVVPADPLLTENPPLFGFTVDSSMANLERLGCYASGQGRVHHERLGTHRIEVRLKAPLPPGRSRINCTIPGRDGRWYWFGTLFYLPRR
jgi:peptidoglycan/xylan/chitin deacetylase (PgdA/CDA1 family)